MKIFFMGTPDFAEKSLEALYNNGYEIVGVATKVDRPKGRGMKMQASPVKVFANSKELKVFQPEKIKNNQEFIESVKKLNPDVICVVAYGKILPKEILEIPKLGCINVHGSILPKYRGAAPIQWAVINGDETTGVTTIFMDEGMDTGDIILKKEINIEPDETTGEIWEKLSFLGAAVLIDTMKKIENGNVKKIKQPEEYSIAPMLKKEMALIDWENKTGKEIKNLVRGLNPIMGAFSYLNKKKFKFWKVDNLTYAQFVGKFTDFKEYERKLKKMEPGAILISNDKDGLYIVTKDSVISILEIQAENSKRLEIKSFLRGNEFLCGEIFE